jgi:hypothetical protein
MGKRSRPVCFRPSKLVIPTEISAAVEITSLDFNYIYIYIYIYIKCPELRLISCAHSLLRIACQEIPGDPSAD